jgi:hypothetical protein
MLFARFAGTLAEVSEENFWNSPYRSILMTTPEKPPGTPEDDDNNRANIAAIVIVVLLIVFGVWLFNKLTAANDALNCVASGRRNCAELSNP